MLAYNSSKRCYLIHYNHNGEKLLMIDRPCELKLKAIVPKGTAEVTKKKKDLNHGK